MSRTNQPLLPTMLRNILTVLLSMAIAVLARKYLLSVLGTRIVWVTFYPMVMITALYCGWLTGLISAVASCLIAFYGWHLLADQPFINDFADMIGMFAFLFNCAMISGVAEMARRGRERAVYAKEQAEAANERLVSEIQKRRQTEKTLEEANLKLSALSATDGLTGIANRRQFDAVLAREYARLARSGAELSLIMLDLDHFKNFNDNYGHLCGDECLKRVAQVLKDSTGRPADLAARYGGEEFACILPETGQQGALLIAERMRQGIIGLAIRHDGSDAAGCVSASLGLVTVRCDACELVLEVISKADELLYKAKSNGRNRVEFNEIQLWPKLLSDTGLVQLVWKSDYCCGNQLIDSQHRALFRLSNELLGTTLCATPATDIPALISRLIDELDQHSRDEEIILEKAGFPGLNKHSAEHAELLAKCLKLSRDFESSILSPSHVFQFLVCELVILHILGADREFFPFLGLAAVAGAAVTPVDTSNQAIGLEPENPW